ncbi:MAG TPA: NapC/NirT family cytochrome c [Symbiobacteriaceae bacterium]|nr:NapC/NirT family cytochrome c [Symbiobacteriaceae bacterium]
MRRLRWVLAGLAVLLVAAAFTYPLVATATDDVAFCTSCHVMEGQGQTHAVSFHREAATCSDCHTGSIVQKYTDGARHLYHNVTGTYPHPPAIRESSRDVVAAQCFECHADKSLHARQKQARGQNCTECHKGHDPRPVMLPGVDN